MNSLLRLSQGDRIIDLSYITTEQLPLFLEGQRSLFDLQVKDETGRWYIIEMQRKMEKDYLNRTQLYSCYTYVSQIKKGMKHKDLLPVVIISIIGAKALPDELPYISYHHIKESNTHKQYLFSLTYVFN
ncbi:PD-(D/E)XK nuclease family transposase [Rickettsia conorii]|uniref:PD-(D/E)XK nuclease family transposase n=1 Tax=Rickettsia conorii TaxID=781 RepID=UPI0002E8C26C|nr:PD-(D/E)XK nuclease family transposase [Rickettsia conorii]